MADEFSSQSSATIAKPSRGASSLRIERVAEEIQREMLIAWQAGSKVLAEQWLDRHPEVKARPEMAVLVIYEELCLREERGEVVETTELYARFPQFKDALSMVLSCHRLLHSDAAKFPAAGEEFGEFRLLRELGRGGAGRVFLATQPALSDRPLVVKLTPRVGDEHLSLARLQHTHIVPLFLVQEFPERNLRALCMPFLGGASWSSILQALSSSPSRRQGVEIVRTLDSIQSELGLPMNSNAPAIGFLTQASYEKAVCWIGACLADALHHAHQRGLLHLDIKPSNVLLAGDGQPMLLDFHLAHVVGLGLGGHLERVGGTRGYMSPEQHWSIQALRVGSSLPIALDARSDIYSLGVLLYESLAGQRPPADETASRKLLRNVNPAIGRGLNDLLHKCLAEDRESRYADAGELATDLRRHLANLPLRGVANRSLKERWSKWRSRKPHALGAWVIISTALLVIGGAGLFFYADRLQVAQSSLHQAERDLFAEDSASALNRLTTGLNAIRWLPGQSDLKRDLHLQLAAAKRKRVSGALRHLVEQLQFLDNVDDAPSANLRELDAGCRAIWEARSQFAPSDSPAISPNQEKADLLDLVILWTRLSTRDLSASESETKRTEALAVLKTADEMWGPSPALTFARQQLDGQAISDDQIAAFLTAGSSRTAWELDTLGRILLQTGKLQQARQFFERATQLAPAAFWPYFHLTLCAYRSERFEEALRAASVCVALFSEQAECYFNRAVCLQAVGQNEGALRDFTRALQLAPDLSAAALRRGMLLAELGHEREALDDLARSIELGGEPARAWYQMALVHFKQANSMAARKCIAQSLQYQADYEPALSLQRQLEAHDAPATQNGP